MKKIFLNVILASALAGCLGAAAHAAPKTTSWDGYRTEVVHDPVKSRACGNAIDQLENYIKHTLPETNAQIDRQALSDNYRKQKTSFKITSAPEGCTCRFSNAINKWVCKDRVMIHHTRTIY